jgi:3-hydroxyisobutyrate dehydrogenase-like beta-hydroxyacid dehydrogenase
MGAALGRSLRGTGVRVVWVSEGRSVATAVRAEAAGFDDVRTLAGVRECAGVVSICPPEFALDLAEEVAAVGFGGVYLDANAVAPSTAAAVDRVIRKSGATYVDGGVIGGPQAPRVFLSGASAAAVGRWFGDPASVTVLEGSDYAASSLKMVYAGWTKGTTALLFALVAAADALGVGDALKEEWARSQPALAPRLERAGASAAKAWRWSGEMHEIAATLAAAGLPARLHEAAADVYERLASLKDDADASIEEIVALVRRENPTSSWTREGHAMTVTPAALSRPEAPEGSTPFVPSGFFRGDPADFDYVEEEWFASGEAEGHPYATSVFVRRPRDASRFSGTVMVEPVHAMSAAPVWQYVAPYMMRAGHGFAAVCSQKSALDTHVKPFDTERYASLEIWSDAPPPDDAAMAAPPRDPSAMQARMEAMRKLNVLSTPILAQVGAAIADDAGPFAGYDVRHVILAGHSQTGGVVTEYILNGHDAYRRDDGAPVYHGYFPSGAPGVTFGGYDVPIVQVVSDGDISNPNRPGREGRTYRRPDSDEPGDRYRLYELAGVPHMGTRYAPYNDSAMWASGPASVTAGDVPANAAMNSLPHNELFSVAMHHLIAWVADGVTPPRADRIEVGPDGLFAEDEVGNSRGGVRSAQMDVPRLQYFSNPAVGDDGVPARGVVGIELPLSKETLGRLYRDHADYVDRFTTRLDELVAEGWLFPEDVDEMRNEAEKADVP